MSDVIPNLRSLFVVCSDLPRSRDFYEKLGFPCLEEKSRSLILDCGMKVELHLHQPLEAQEESLFGVGNAPGSPAFVQSYTVKNLDTIAHKMKEPEVLFGPKETPWGDRILVVKDPDGHRLEFREERE